MIHLGGKRDEGVSTMILCTSSTPLRPFPSSSRRSLCADRKGPLDHFRPRPILLSTIRVGLVTSSTIFTNFMSDQIELESNRLDMVKKGSMNIHQAEKENEEWETREWKIRWEEFPKKFWYGLCKYHSMVLCMRLYEYLASKIVSEETMDKLTKDTFRDAKINQRSVSDSFTMNLWANTISFMADCTIHQVIFVYGYYVYYTHQRNKLQQPQSNDDNDGGGGMVLSLLLKSTKLTVTRSIALVAASTGGALGTLVYPGWGTLLGTQFGESTIASLTD